jgi:hypothetical protein
MGGKVTENRCHICQEKTHFKAFPTEQKEAFPGGHDFPSVCDVLSAPKPFDCCFSNSILETFANFRHGKFNKLQ